VNDVGLMMAFECRMNWTLISAVNNEAVLKSCLLNSSEAQAASEVILQTGFSSAALAYNDAIRKAKTDVLVFAHQDVYLPEGWAARVEQALTALEQVDPNWAVLGIWGIDASGRGTGDVYCTFSRRHLGGMFEGVREVRCFDEVLLIIRKSSGVRFDEELKGFHFYGTDIALEAARQGKKCYALSAFCIHNTNGYKMLPLEFWKNYFFMRRKWKRVLPIQAPCAKVTFWCWPMIKWNIVRCLHVALNKYHPGKRVPDPGLLYRDMLAKQPDRPAQVA
jgi:Glycosyltransferase like family